VSGNRRRGERGERATAGRLRGVYTRLVAQLLGLRVKNFKSLADVTVGHLSYARDHQSYLSPVSCFIGRNGCGKSSLLDVVAFLSDCLREGIEAACDKEHRGGFDRLRTQGQRGPIRFELYFRLAPSDRPMKYEFAVHAPEGIPRIASERLFLSSERAQRGALRKFLEVEDGAGTVWAKDGDETSDTGRQVVHLTDLDRLAISTYGQLPDHPRIGAFRQYLESWYLSYFVPGDARRLPAVGAQRRLDRTGSNMGNVLQYLERQHGPKLATILQEIADVIPGIETIKTKASEDKRLLIEFSERGYLDPFFQYAMSDGTLKMFAYLLLLHDPEPPAFIGIEEPENGLYHQLHSLLSTQLLQLSDQFQGKTQILVTTHSPYFVNELQPEAVWTMSKQRDGTTKVVRANKIRGVSRMLREGIPLGSLWYSNHLDQDA
jgi:predicted ATPase